jgi:hypothetical protein
MESVGNAGDQSIAVTPLAWDYFRFYLRDDFHAGRRDSFLLIFVFQAHPIILPSAPLPAVPIPFKQIVPFSPWRIVLGAL